MKDFIEIQYRGILLRTKGRIWRFFYRTKTTIRRWMLKGERRFYKRREGVRLFYIEIK